MCPPVDFLVAEVDIEKRFRISTATRAHRLVLLLVVALLHLLDGSVTPPTECVFTLHGVLLLLKNVVLPTIIHPLWLSLTDSCEYLHSYLGNYGISTSL